jgi:hypothetical protein
MSKYRKLNNPEQLLLLFFYDCGIGLYPLTLRRDIRSILNMSEKEILHIYGSAALC